MMLFNAFISFQTHGNIFPGVLFRRVRTNYARSWNSLVTAIFLNQDQIYFTSSVLWMAQFWDQEQHWHTFLSWLGSLIPCDIVCQKNLISPTDRRKQHLETDTDNLNRADIILFGLLALNMNWICSERWLHCDILNPTVGDEFGIFWLSYCHIVNGHSHVESLDAQWAWRLYDWVTVSHIKGYTYVASVRL